MTELRVAAQALAVAIGSVRDGRGLSPPEGVQQLVDSLEDADNSGNVYDDSAMLAAYAEALGRVRLQPGEVSGIPAPDTSFDPEPKP